MYWRQYLQNALVDVLGPNTFAWPKACLPVNVKGKHLT